MRRKQTSGGKRMAKRRGGLLRERGGGVGQLGGLGQRWGGGRKGGSGRIVLEPGG